MIETNVSREVIGVFDNLYSQKAFVGLPEAALIRPPSAETYFIMAAIAAHIELFDDLDHTSRKNYRCRQRVFFGNKLDGVGTTPLANPLEQSLSLFHMKVSSPGEVIQDVLEFLFALGFRHDSIYVRCAADRDLLSGFRQVDILPDNIFPWQHLAPFRIGSSRPQGLYSYMYIGYKHGLVPVGSIGFIHSDGFWFTDTAIFQERLVMMLTGAGSLYESILFKEIWEVVNGWRFARTSFDVNRIATFVRAIVFLAADGLWDVSARGPGHVFKRLLREVAFLIHGAQLGLDDWLHSINAVKHCARSQGYTLGLPEAVVEHLRVKINRYSHTIAKQLTALSSNRPVDETDAKRIMEEHGLRPEWIVEDGATADLRDLFGPFIRQRNSIRNKALSFDPSEYTDIRDLLSEQTTEGFRFGRR